MECQEVRPFVSALHDGERIPGAAAEHITKCETCKGRLREYAQMGVEFRLLASASSQEIPASVPALPPRRQRWRQTLTARVLVPRFAFGLMLVAILSLSAGIAIVRANNSERWFQFEVRTREGATALTGLTSTEPKEPEPPDVAPVIAHEPEGTLAFIVRVLGGSGGSERLGVRAIWLPQYVDRSEIEGSLGAVPEREFWVIPGQRLSVPVKDYGEIEITGQLLDKLPDDQNPNEMRLYPKEGQFRVIGPQVLLMDDSVLSKGGGSGLEFAQTGYFFAYYAPHNGWYIFAFEEFPGATEGKIKGNQVEFTLDGRTYTFLAAAPIVDASVTTIWVRRHAGNRLLDSDPISPDRDSHPSTMFGNLKSMLEHITKE